MFRYGQRKQNPYNNAKLQFNDISSYHHIHEIIWTIIMFTCVFEVELAVNS
jgi:hypothetical protein